MKNSKKVAVNYSKMTFPELKKLLHDKYEGNSGEILHGFDELNLTAAKKKAAIIGFLKRADEAEAKAEKEAEEKDKAKAAKTPKAPKAEKAPKADKAPVESVTLDIDAELTKGLRGLTTSAEALAYFEQIIDSGKYLWVSKTSKQVCSMTDYVSRNGKPAIAVNNAEDKYFVSLMYKALVVGTPKA